MTKKSARYLRPMKFFPFLFFIFTILFFQNASAQKKFTVSGYVKENSTGEMLLGANVYVKPSLKGTNTNQYGFYSLTLPAGNYTLVISYIGFAEQQFEIVLDKNIHQNIEMKENVVETKEVTVSALREDHNVSSMDMGKQVLEVEKQGARQRLRRKPADL